MNEEGARRRYMLGLTPTKVDGVLYAKPQVELYVTSVSSQEPFVVGANGLIVEPEYAPSIFGPWKRFDACDVSPDRTILRVLMVHLRAYDDVYVRKVGRIAALLGFVKCE